MNRRLQNIAEQQGGPFTRAQALQCGVSDEQMRRYVRTGEWRRLRRGAYAFAAAYDPLDALAQHAVMVRAVLLVLGDRVAVSHASAAVLHGYPLWNVDLSQVHVTRAGHGSGRREGGVVHHLGRLDAGDVVCRDGLPVVRPARAALETAATSSFEAGVVTADFALHCGDVTSEELLAEVELMDSWAGVTIARAVAEFADGRSESPGESRLRVLFREEGLPEPELQRAIHDGAGLFVGRVDFCFPEQRTIVEFDGMAKYGADPAGAAESVFQEKQREDRLRELGWEVVRVTWADLARPAYTARRIRRAFERARRHRGPSARLLGA